MKRDFGQEVSFTVVGFDESLIETLLGTPPQVRHVRRDLLVEAPGLLPTVYRDAVVEEVRPGVFTITSDAVEVYRGEEAGWQRRPW